MLTGFLRPLLIVATLGLWAPITAQAQNQAAPSIEQQQKSAWEAAGKVSKDGPAAIPLAGQITFDLPAGYTFIPQPEAGNLLRSFGNTPSQDLLGMVVSSGPEEWIATLRFVSAGYIKDDDAKDWDVDGLLKSLREGTEADNKDRVARGFRALEVRDWIERPAYDSANHRLVWSAMAVEKGGAENDASVNYNTYVLGREGYVSLNFITTPQQIPTEKAIAHKLLTSISYVSGKTYADFNASTDRVAEYGLAALVAGAAAKKLGFFALLAALAAKFGKVIVAGLAALGFGAFKLFRRNAA